MYLVHCVFCQNNYIDDCQIKSNSDDSYTLSLICGDTDNSSSIFHPNYIECSNGDQVYYVNIGIINFKNCQLMGFDTFFLQNYTHLNQFDISNVDLVKLRIRNEESEQLSSMTLFNASHNRLAAFPSSLFSIAISLNTVDFSSNIIIAIYDSDFVGASNLTTLDLSNNRLLEISSNLFASAKNLLFANFSTNQIQRLSADAFAGAKNLTTLNLSSNQLTSLEEHLFDSNRKLTNLDLSYNPIGNLEIDTLAFLTELEYLNLRRTNLTDFAYGTFSFQPKLISLDLSENNLKYFDFDLFMPFVQSLKSLRLNDNQLRVLVRFENELFPNLSLLDIRNNAFRCVFLIEFIKAFNWSKINFPLDPSSANRKKTSIRGITCD